MTGAPVMRPLWYEFPDDTAEDTFDGEGIRIGLHVDLSRRA